MPAEIDPSDDYATKLAKLLPAEGTAALLAINRLIPDETSTQALAVEILAGVVAVFVALWAFRIRGIKSGMQIAFLLVAYVIWASSIIWDRITPSVGFLSDNPWLPAALAIVFTLFIPLAFPTRPQP
jgi:hypothetical protein